MMKSNDRWDSLIRYWTEQVWPGLAWKLIKAQAMAESGMDPIAKSPAGAVGLLQLMPQTDLEIDGEIDGTNVDGNLKDGITYLRRQFDHFSEIPDNSERLKFALASYNCGRGYVNRALELAYQNEFAEELDPQHLQGKPGQWQKWGYTSQFLPAVEIKGHHIDYRQTLGYVDKIWKAFTMPGGGCL